MCFECMPTQTTAGIDFLIVYTESTLVLPRVMPVNVVAKHVPFINLVQRANDAFQLNMTVTCSSIRCISLHTYPSNLIVGGARLLMRFFRNSSDKIPDFKPLYGLVLNSLTAGKDRT